MRFITRWLLSLCLFFGALLVWTAFAYADGGGSIEPPNTTAVIIGSVLSSIGIYLAHRLIRVFEQKTGIDVPEREEQLVDKWVADGVALAEEKARMVAKLGKGPHPAEKKHEIATDYTMDRIDRAGMRQHWPREVVGQKTDAKVNTKREPNHAVPRPPTLPPA